MDTHIMPPGMDPGEPEPDPVPDAIPAIGSAPSEERSQFVEPYTRLRTALLRAGRRLRLAPDVVDDIVQIVSLRLFERPKKEWMAFDEKRFLAFVIVQFHAEHRRKQDRDGNSIEVPQGDAGADYWNTAAPSSPNPEDTLLGNDLKARIDREVARWSDAKRNPYLLQEKGWPRADIADELDITLSAVDSQLASAKESLRVLLDADYPDVRQRGNTRTIRREDQ